ncbi:rhomboid family intramembrane serine protease [Octadecabacter sp. SW4]|uniref:rhomboid family intramembrane serine protease n=1 Tax=Octadecabacter sp. SW4 TaxID=2602067 RepID=UPI0011C1DEC1|nr:rhomboid family intramembrane serine protease [Octadecabacter sp. SW4]QEE36284.1 rhomboid family intramembrane serine protease [Octadecabacter sp. SW4]
MFPIRDHNPSLRTPYVTYALITANVAVFLYGLAALQSPLAERMFLFDYAMIPRLISQGDGQLGLLTHMFIHGGWMHIAGNMLFLYVYGDNLEEEMGHVGFLLFYLGCGLVAGYAQYLMAPTSPIPMVGASGAIAGVMGGYLLLFPKAKIDVLVFLLVFIRIIPIPAFIMLGLWFGLQLLNGVGTSPLGGGVAYWAHIGGFVAGLVATVPLWLRRGGTRFWDRTHGHPPHPPAHYPVISSRIPRVRR